MLRKKIIVRSIDPKIKELMFFSRGVYNNITNTWVVPSSPRLLWRLYNKGYILDRNARSAFKEYRKMIIPDHLYTFQKIGVKRLEYYGGVCLLADEMGLGKTIQLLTWWEITGRVPAILVCPAYLRLNEVSEIIKWTKLSYQIINDGHTKLKAGIEIYIISYNLLPKYKNEFAKMRPKSIAADEAQYIKSPKVARSKAFKWLSRKIPSRILMTGTPITNRTSELWNLLNILNPIVWRNKRDFQWRYCDPRKGNAGFMQFKGTTNVHELRKKIKATGYIRRVKDKVLKELPKKIRQIIPLEITNKKEYMQAEKNIVNYFNSQGLDEKANNASRAEHITKLTELKKLAGIGKLAGVEKFVKDKIDDGYHIIIFGIHKDPLKKLHAKFPKSGLIIGSTSHKKRQGYVDSFQAGITNPLFGNVDSMGTGITLTKATIVIMFEYPWTPASVDQAEDRAHRNGQKDTVLVYYMVGLDTIDEPMVEMIDQKRLAFREVFDKGEITSNDNIITQLLKQYYK